MEGLEFSAQFEQWANEILIWVGFGTVTGLVAKAIMPGRDPGGPLATLAMGICGSIIGCESQSLRKMMPITGTPYRLAYASQRSVILAFFRVLAGYWIDETNVPLAHRERAPRRRRRRRRRSIPVDVDEYEY